MRVLMLEAPQAMLDERRRLGHAVRDEMWDGVLHMVPPPGGADRDGRLEITWDGGSAAV